NSAVRMNLEIDIIYYPRAEYPRSITASTVWEPMNPAPPTTSTRSRDSSTSSRAAIVPAT
ncbi:MAG: hypothetical protein WCA98_16760, partial [Candidatus Acidiferrales bacterium]